MRRTATVLVALAGFVPLPLPPGASQTDSSSIAEFAASGDTWVARTRDQGELQFSGDAGTAWRTIKLDVDTGAGIAVGPDGGFWLPGGGSSGSPTLVHVSKTGLVSTQPIAIGRGLFSAPAWDEQGRMWVALS